jgi:hypothetical protein
MSALAPIAEGSPPLQPRADSSASALYSTASSAPDESSNRAKRALFGAGG